MNTLAVIYFVSDFLQKFDLMKETHKKKLMEAQKLFVKYQIGTQFSKQHTLLRILPD